MYFFLDIDNNFTMKKSYILSFIAKLPPVFSVNKLTALQIIPDSSAMDSGKELAGIIKEAKERITESILKEHERKGAYNGMSRVNLIANMIDDNVKDMALYYARFVLEGRFENEKTIETFGKDYLGIAYPAYPAHPLLILSSIIAPTCGWLPKEVQQAIQQRKQEITGKLQGIQGKELCSEFYKRVIFHLFYISILANSHNESEKKAIWDLSNRWNIDTSAISDMDESAERMLDILKRKISVITDKTIPYKEAKPMVEALDAEWAAELATVRTLLFGKDKGK
jgi:hypothetical protein